MTSHFHQQACDDIRHTSALGEREELHRDMNFKLPIRQKSLELFRAFLFPLYFLAVRFEVLGSNVVPLYQSKGMAVQVSQ